MGWSMTANCPCGFERSSFMMGYGMATGDRVFLGPCLCRRCHDIHVGNIKETPVLCPQCGQESHPYGNPRPGKRFAGVDLESGTFECPKCGQNSLEFGPGTILWD